MQDNKTQAVYLQFKRPWVEKLLMMTVFIILLKPAWIGTLGGINRLWTLAQMGVFAAAVVVASVNAISLHTLLIAAVYGLFMLSSLYNGTAPMDTLRAVLPYAGMALVCDWWMRCGRGKAMIRSLCWVLVAYVYLNFLSVILFPGGLYTAVTSDGVTRVKCWFLGYKNPQIRFLLPALTLLAVVKWNGRKRCLPLSFLLTALVVLATVILVDSATSILVTMGFAALLFLFRRDEGRLVRLFTPGRLIFCFAAATMLIVIMQKTSVVGSMLAVLFPDRNVASFSYRTSVWSAAFEHVRKNWLIGQGHTRFVSNLGFGVSHPHNFFLYYWLYGGIFALAAVMLLWYRTLQRVYLARRRFVGRVLLSAITMVFVMGVVEALTEFPVLYGLTAIAFHIDRLDDSEMDHSRLLLKTRSLNVIW